VAASIRIHCSRGVAAVTLSSGELQATFVPELNMLGISLRLGGEEFLALPGGVAAYRRRHATGLPLLAPWANRLSERSYRVGDVPADLRDADLSTDPNGLPIHGTMWGEEWQIESISARVRSARMRSTFEYGRADLLTVFPFPHQVVPRSTSTVARFRCPRASPPPTTVRCRCRSASIRTCACPEADAPRGACSCQSETTCCWTIGASRPAAGPVREPRASRSERARSTTSTSSTTCVSSASKGAVVG
jgi:hypothetical protein